MDYLNVVNDQVINILIFEVCIGLGILLFVELLVTSSSLTLKTTSFFSVRMTSMWQGLVWSICLRNSSFSYFYSN